jgi:hypothetical protein
MMMKPSILTTAIALGLGVTSAQAALVGYTDYGAFTSRLGELKLTAVEHNFDRDANGTAIAGDTSITAGQTVDGIEFTSFTLGDGNGNVSTDALWLAGADASDLGTVPLSSPNQIGINNSGNEYQLLDGTTFTFTTPETSAFGLYILSAEILALDDFSLSFGGISQSNGTTAGAEGFEYFVGIIDDSGATYNSATFSAPFFSTKDILFTLDDFRTAAPAPAPAPILLMGLGLGILAWRNRR